MGAPRERRVRAKGSGLPLAEALYLGVVGGPFDSAVPAQIVIGPVAVFFSIGLIMLLVVGNQVVERESVVACNKIDTLFRLTLFMAVNVGAGQQPCRDL